MIRVPLSVQQEEMWALRAEQPGGFYNETVHHRIRGALDEQALRQALDWLVERHEPLRTRFRVGDGGDGGEPYQSIVQGVAAPLELVDLRQTAAAERADRLRALVAEQNETAFDAAVAPLFCARAYLVDDELTEVALTCDHLIYDETSLAILVSDLDHAYRALAAGGSPNRPGLPLQYADYAVWQRRWLTDARVHAQRDYWRRTLAGMPLRTPAPFAPVAPPGSAPPGTNGEREHVPVPLSVEPQAYTSLCHAARLAGATPFAFCAAAVGSVVAALTGETDCVLITTVSCRDRVELERIVGDFANVALLRADLSGDPPFGTIVRRMTDALLGMFEHRYLPFASAWDAVLADLRAAGVTESPQPPIGIEFFRAARDQWAPGVAVVASPPHGVDADAPSMGPLTFTFYDDGTELWGHLRYNPAMVDRRSAQAIAADFGAVLTTAMAEPGIRLGSLAEKAIEFPRICR